MKQRIIYIAIAAIAGLGIGYLLFGDAGTSNGDNTTHDHSTAVENQMWTCSMHPQIMQPEPGDCPICGMDLIPAESGEQGLSPEQFAMTENALALANVQTTLAGSGRAGDVSDVTVSGKIAVNEESIAVQASYFDGRIERLNVNYEGQQVRKGQMLATIYSPELVAAQQELLTAVSLKESQPQLYGAVRNKMKLWKLSENQIDKIESSGEITENFPVYATVSGTVSEVMSAEGDYVKKGQPIVKVSNLNTVWAAFDAYESQLALFKRGQVVRITTNAYPGKTFEGTISYIDPVLNTTTRTVTVRATLNNADGLFKPGMFINGSIALDAEGEADSTFWIPSSAVMWTGERSLVYVKVKPDEAVFEMREVVLGARKGEEVEIVSGLKAGEEIVTHGTFTVDAAAQLQGKKSMMNRSGGPSMTGHEGHLGSEPGPDSKDMGQAGKMEFTEAFQRQFGAVIASYLRMKNALVASDANQTAQYAKASMEALNKADVSEQQQKGKIHLAQIREKLEAISATENLEAQREHFVSLNEHMVAVAESLSSLENTLYVQRCPMANNNKGAVWLSTEKEIRNPYYGDKMMSCGEILEELGS
ncbi:efflux RND transporter periplasmic adaptor subunit [Robiginitalea sp. IMCC44478]|uniref:efflux RND transporter periplasmic adaptor subunit n=1 Tax=Robiginitalea sp. IMCC44478 TaxID=3459122 RepID=UPI004043679F